MKRYDEWTGMMLQETAAAVQAMDLLAWITLDELISFESQLFEDPFFALDHPVGKKIILNL